MIKNRLSAILGEKRITQKELSEMTGIRPNTINDMYHEMAERVSLDHLSRICEVLEIELSELLVYKPNKIKRDWENE